MTNLTFDRNTITSEDESKNDLENCCEQCVDHSGDATLLMRKDTLCRASVVAFGGGMTKLIERKTTMSDNEAQQKIEARNGLENYWPARRRQRSRDFVDAQGIVVAECL